MKIAIGCDPNAQKEKEEVIAFIEKKVECYARECRARRANRVAILKRKRELGLISFESRVRYAQRSELAQKRDRCSGRFMKDIEYMDV